MFPINQLEWIWQCQSRQRRFKLKNKDKITTNQFHKEWTNQLNELRFCFCNRFGIGIPRKIRDESFKMIWNLIDEMLNDGQSTTKKWKRSNRFLLSRWSQSTSDVRYLIGSVKRDKMIYLRYRYRKRLTSAKEHSSPGMKRVDFPHSLKSSVDVH